jgi:hypothetical protein
MSQYKFLELKNKTSREVCNTEDYQIKLSVSCQAIYASPASSVLPI